MFLRTWEVKLTIRLPSNTDFDPEHWNWTFQLQLNPACGEAVYLESCEEVTDKI